MKANLINAERIAAALGIPWTHPRRCISETGEEEILDRVFEFALRENATRPSVILTVYSSATSTVKLDLETMNGYWSEILFEGVTDIGYDPQYRIVEFRRSNVATLKVWRRGQFDIIIAR
jgi:hypothetical protein